MALLLRSFLFKDPHHLMIGFKSFILPIVEYCSVVWNPHHLKDILHLESVQRAFTKRLPGLRELSYSHRLKTLNVQTLERRRLQNDLIFCFKILHGLVCDLPENYGLVLATRRSRGHSLKLEIKQSRIDVRKNYFACRVVKPWNSLPDDLVTSTTVQAFKAGIELANLSDYLVFK